MNSMEMRFLRRITGKTRLDRIRNETYRETSRVEAIEETTAQGQLEHVMKMREIRLVRKIYEAEGIGKRKKRTLEKTWNEKVQKQQRLEGEMGAAKKYIQAQYGPNRISVEQTKDLHSTTTLTPTVEGFKGLGWFNTCLINFNRFVLLPNAFKIFLLKQ